MSSERSDAFLYMCAVWLCLSNKPASPTIRPPPLARTPRRTELDYGLGKREEGGSVEAVLVVADPPALARLVSAATGGSSSNSSSGDDAGSGGSEDGTAAAAADGCVVVEVDGWNEGVAAEQQKILDSWRSLRPRLAGAKKGARASLH